MTQARDLGNFIEVALATDRNLARSASRPLVEGAAGLRLAAEFPVDGLAGLVKDNCPDVLVLDLAAGSPAALEAIAGIRRTCDCAILVLAAGDDPGFARDARQVGAKGYVTRDAAEAELVEAIRTLAGGGSHFTPVARRTRPAPRKGGHDDLTEREIEVLRLIALGHTNTEIAAQLFLSVRTVESHRAAIHRKLSLVTRAQLVRHALERGLLSAFL
jgi:two-component system response regulator NreC